MREIWKIGSTCGKLCNIVNFRDWTWPETRRESNAVQCRVCGHSFEAFEECEACEAFEEYETCEEMNDAVVLFPIVFVEFAYATNPKCGASSNTSFFSMNVQILVLASSYIIQLTKSSMRNDKKNMYG